LKSKKKKLYCAFIDFEKAFERLWRGSIVHGRLSAPNRAILRAEKNNKTCDKLSFDYKTSCEKIHTKYCKIILGL
jgi:hypothetical protein